MIEYEKYNVKYFPFISCQRAARYSGKACSLRAMAVLMMFTLAGAALDTFCAMPHSLPFCTALAESAKHCIPLAASGFGWVIFAAAGWAAAAAVNRAGRTN
jgi:hypothetical protein